MCDCLSTATDFAALHEPVQKLHYDVVHFSQSAFLDFIVYAKNNHPLWSIFLAHPQHTYDRRERLVSLLCSTVFACGIAFIMNATETLNTRSPHGVRTETHRNVAVGVIFAVLYQMPYDACLRGLLKCNCVQTWATWPRLRNFIGECITQP